MVSNPIMQMFARSPFGPIQEHITKSQECARGLEPFFLAVVEQDWDSAEKAQHKIAILEGEADSMKREIRLHLPSSIFLPVPRTDLLELVRMQDKIANKAKDIAGLMLGRKMTFPEVLRTEMVEFLGLALKTSEQAVTAMQELDELVTSGFRGREVDLVERLINELDDLEHNTDEQERKVRGILFEVEDDLNPIDVMFLYRIIDWVGDLANRAQQVGSRLQILVAR